MDSLRKLLAGAIYEKRRERASVKAGIKGGTIYIEAQSDSLKVSSHAKNGNAIPQRQPDKTDTKRKRVGGFLFEGNTNKFPGGAFSRMYNNNNHSNKKEMERKAGDVIEGRDLMLYVNVSADEAVQSYVPQAAATSHTITYSGESKERVTKDSASGAYSEKKVTKLSVAIKCEALVSFGTAAGYDALLEAMKNRKTVKLKYGFAQEQNGDKYEEGLFVITSLEQTSPAGDDATYSAQFENSGPVETKQKTSANN